MALYANREARDVSRKAFLFAKRKALVGRRKVKPGLLFTVYGFFRKAEGEAGLRFTVHGSRLLKRKALVGSRKARGAGSFSAKRQETGVRRFSFSFRAHALPPSRAHALPLSRLLSRSPALSPSGGAQGQVSTFDIKKGG